ncbi:MAG: hypothetical protein LBF09_04170 [Odoribacteraceae bacterium]|jgi:hypothetical protein|nr:hypothetical protein [Odoribacteraceae bacterium]
MKQKITQTARFLLLLLLVNGCNKDLGNYTYDYNKAPKLIIDTIGHQVAWRAVWNIGDTIDLSVNVTYPGREGNLVYRWFLMDYPYSTVTDGNAQVWPAPDTISRERDLHYVVDLKPGRWVSISFMAKDTVNGVAEFYTYSYKSIPEAGALRGLYCLQEKDGRVDIDVVGSSRALVFSNYHEVDYYSSFHPGEPLTGKPRVFEYSTPGGYFYVFTDDVGLRVHPASMVIMERWNEMFYQTPATYAPGAVTGVNNCDFLVNDGKLHVHYIQATGERKFSNPIPGNYALAPYLAKQTIASWGAVAGAINAYQIVYDENTNAFRPFFNKGVSLGQFTETVPDAAFDVNNIAGELVYANTVNAGETMLITRDEEGYHMGVSCFYNVIDEGKLARSTRLLTGCTGIENATCFASGLAGPALFYGTGNSVYSFSYTTGQTVSRLLWQGDPGDEVTALCLLSTGGFPTSGRILWIAVWNEATRAGRLVEFEINPVSGEAEALYAPMFSGIPDNPIYHEGLGKVLFMTQKIS